MSNDLPEQSLHWIPATQNARLLLGESVTSKAWPDFLRSMEGVSCDLSPEAWRMHILKGEADEDGLLVRAIASARREDFVFWLGQETFITSWPKLRGVCPRKNFGRRKSFDQLWTRLATSSRLPVPPLPAWSSLSSFERRVLICVCNAPQHEEAWIASRLLLTTDDVHEVLHKLVDLHFLVENNQLFSTDPFYLTYQVPRPISAQSFLVDGEVRTFVNSADW
ncbi:MAG: hypothetical protein J5846_02710 [Desulfovibrio sp.]|nr:hypothetical protein [Desulfovibrio sp.]